MKNLKKKVQSEVHRQVAESVSWAYKSYFDVVHFAVGAEMFRCVFSQAHYRIYDQVLLNEKS